jgi:putative oxidoreductase
MLNRPLPVPARDALLLLTRVLLGVIMFAHGYQKMVVKGIGRTTEGFESLSIPLAIVSASFVTVVEFAGSVLLVLGALTPLVSACNLVIMAGAALFVHGKNGIFIADELPAAVGAIAAGFLVLAAVGPGRWSVDHLIARRQDAHREALRRAGAGAPQRPAAHPAARSAAHPAPHPVAHAASADLWTPPLGTSTDRIRQARGSGLPTGTPLAGPVAAAMPQVPGMPENSSR